MRPLNSEQRRRSNLDRRRLRIRLAPTGSRRDRWFRQVSRKVAKLRRAPLASVLARLLPGPFARRLRAYQRNRLRQQLAAVRQELDDIVRKYGDAETTIIFPPSLDWHTQLFQRPQHLALSLSQQGALVFYLQLQHDPDAPPFVEIEPRLYLCNTPVETFEDLPQPLIYLLTWNRKFVQAFDRPRVIYDYVDEVEVFDGDPAQLLQEHHALVESATLVLATAVNLYEATKTIRPDTLLCPNGVSYQHFAGVCLGDGDQPVPDDLLPILAEERPIVGYYGALAEWFDYALLGQVAEARSDLSFLLIGPDYDSTLPPDLVAMPNVFWLDARPYATLPAYLRYFDVATIPFRLNAITHATSPLKLFEYMAACKPVVITPMQESMRYAGVLVARDALEFSAQLDRALEMRHDQTYLATLKRVAQENTWEARARQILAHLPRR
jgi:glycosyltransferase involved in cell wall biosynthesis